MENLVKNIVKNAKILKDKYTDQKDALINYACIFCQSDKEEKNFLKLAHELGTVIQETKAGPVFKIPPLNTVAGKLQLLKIRNPDLARPERGDADFSITDYLSFKEKYLNKPGFSLIQKENFEMIELYEKGSNVRVYFSFPPLDEQLGLKYVKDVL